MRDETPQFSFRSDLFSVDPREDEETNPLGQTQFELGNMERASDELARAYLQEGLTIFRDEDPKYVAFIKSKLPPPPGGWPEGW